MIRVAITVGDPAGIGPEIIYKGLKRFRDFQKAKIYIIGEKICFLNQGYDISEIKEVKFIEVPCIKRMKYKLGRVNKICAQASFFYFKVAIKMIKDEKFDCLVTGPLNKKALNSVGIKFRGHTEELERYFNTKIVMLMSSPQFKVSLFTRHIPLKKVSSRIKEKSFKEHLNILVKGLQEMYKIKNPKIGVCAFNPHAGEEGIFGDEEKILKKVIRKIRNASVQGPFPSDTLFLRRGDFDCIVCLYHDQAMIPFKLLNFREGCNVSLGLKFVRTSPAHGTAYDIAGKDKADSGSFLYALKEAINLSASLSKNAF